MPETSCRRGAIRTEVLRLDAVNDSSDRISWDGEGGFFLLWPDDRVTLATDPHEIAVIDPLLLEEFDSVHPWR